MNSNLMASQHISVLALISVIILNCSGKEAEVEAVEMKHTYPKK